MNFGFDVVISYNAFELVGILNEVGSYLFQDGYKIMILLKGQKFQDKFCCHTFHYQNISKEGITWLVRNYYYLSNMNEGGWYVLVMIIHVTNKMNNIQRLPLY